MKTTLRIPAGLYARLMDHLFPGDLDEHGAVILAGLRTADDEVTLLARELHLAADADFAEGTFGYRQITPRFVAETAGRAGMEQLVYLSCHNHPGSRSSVRFSPDDLRAHERLFPHLLDLTEAPLVGGLVFGTDAVAGDLWFEEGKRLPLDETRVIGAHLLRLHPNPVVDLPSASAERFDRQARLFGAQGQALLAHLNVGVIGAGGGGSLVIEQLARLGVGMITAVDFDRVEESNLSRIVGANESDARDRVRKIDVARRLVAEIDKEIGFRGIEGDIADAAVADALLACDFLFLATDTARARLVFNAIAHQYLIPGVQIGAKVEIAPSGAVEEIYVAVRPVFPPNGCFDCADLLDPFQLQREERTPEEQEAQDYIGAPAGDAVVDPAVISLNGISASHAVTRMLLSVIGLGRDDGLEHWLHFPIDGSSFSVTVHRRPTCLFCSEAPLSALARGDSRPLPTRYEVARSYAVLSTDSTRGPRLRWTPAQALGRIWRQTRK